MIKPETVEKLCKAIDEAIQEEDCRFNNHVLFGFLDKLSEIYGTTCKDCPYETRSCNFKECYFNEEKIRLG